MTYEVLENGQVLEVEQTGTVVMKKAYCMSKKVELIRTGNGVQVKIRSWEGGLLLFEPVEVTVVGEGVQTVTEICSDGLVELQGLVGVSVTVTATATGMDSAELVVML